MTMYDRINSNVLIIPKTNPISIKLINYARYNSNYTGELNSYDINLEINDFFMVNSGSIQIYFPFNAAGLLNFMPISCFLIESSIIAYARQCNLSTYSNTDSINYVQIFDVCQSNSCKDYKILLRIKNLRNPTSLKPLDKTNTTNFYGVQTLTKDNKIIAFATTNNVSGIGLTFLSFKNVALNISESITSEFLLNFT